MDIVLVVMRLVHILAGTFWVGAALLTTFFVEPAARGLGPEGGKFMQRLSGAHRMPVYMSLAALLTTLAGLWLYWRASVGFVIPWILAPSGLTLTIGALAGILAAILGSVVMSPTAKRMAELGKAMQAAGGPPQPEQLAAMGALQARLHRAGLWDAALLIVSVTGMAVARYV